MQWKFKNSFGLLWRHFVVTTEFAAKNAYTCGDGQCLENIAKKIIFE